MNINKYLSVMFPMSLLLIFVSLMFLEANLGVARIIFALAGIITFSNLGALLYFSKWE